MRVVAPPLPPRLGPILDARLPAARCTTSRGGGSALIGLEIILRGAPVVLSMLDHGAPGQLSLLPAGASCAAV